ncbi:MAG: TetR/AcrR family transcriptional regulator [Bacteroidetes bacterium]|nr:TetR/AcrR family transcriptional regulator [Bacteroidota bacterium]
MAESQNKKKVLESALKLFNRDGLVNVRLQHISDEAIVSVGNMAYHYKNKDAIVGAIWDQLLQEQRLILQEFKILPLFEDMERMLRSLFRLQHRYQFFYLDCLEVVRAFPEIGEAFRAHQGWQAVQIEMMMEFNVARGAFVSEPEPGYFKRLSVLFWMHADLWMYRQQVLGQPTDDYFQFRISLWSLLEPLFSDMGKKEFVQINAMVLENML